MEKRLVNKIKALISVISKKELQSNNNAKEIIKRIKQKINSKDVK